MLKTKWIVCLACLCSISFMSVTAREGNLTVQELITAHLKSIGAPEDIKSLRSRVMSGSALAYFATTKGGSGGFKDGEFVLASEPDKMGIRVAFSSPEYPGEFIAYNGNEVTVSHIAPGQRSPFAEFIHRNDSVLKKGWLGGTLSMAWPLLNLEGNPSGIEYAQGQIEGHPVHQLISKVKDMRITMSFDEKSFRHMRTEYRARNDSMIADQMSYAPMMTGDINGDWQMTFDHRQLLPSIMGVARVPDSKLLLVEKFEDFSKAGDLTLPYRYTIEYSVEGQGIAYAAKWAMRASPNIIINGQIDSSFFRAQK